MPDEAPYPRLMSPPERVRRDSRNLVLNKSSDRIRGLFFVIDGASCGNVVKVRGWRAHLDDTTGSGPPWFLG